MQDNKSVMMGGERREGEREREERGREGERKSTHAQGSKMGKHGLLRKTVRMVCVVCE